jgi:hypothetical protein
MLEDNEPFAEHVRMKAVLHHPSGESEIIGFSDWAFVTNRDLEAEKIYEAEEKAKWENMTPEEREHHTEWGPNSNAKLCEEVFERGDEIMYESCERRDYSCRFLDPLHYILRFLFSSSCSFNKLPPNGL